MAVDVLTVTDPPLSRRFVVPDRIDELDGIRGFAAILVVFHHLSQSFPGTPASSVLRLWLAVTHAGWIGVDVFFALSGFLITRALLNTKVFIAAPHEVCLARRIARDVRTTDLKIVGDVIGASQIGLLGRWDVINVARIKSDLRPTGAVYTVLARAPLTAK